VHASDPLPAAEPWRILATTDGSAASTAAVRTGLTLIGGPAEVTLLRAVEPDLGLYPPGTEAMATRWVAEARSNAERHLAEAAKELAGDAAGASAVGTLLHDGAALPAILQAAERRDLVVMATRGSGLGHWFLGSTAERVAQRACVPVLAVPLDGCAIGGPVAEDAPSDEQC
jgi:nucleotide-binding universal stress UspA family protein